MPNVVDLGYLENPYLDSPEPYMGGIGLHGVWSQVDRAITNLDRPIGTQADRSSTLTHAKLMQLNRGKLLHVDHCSGYLSYDYLQGPYLNEYDMLTSIMCVHMGTQINRVLVAQNHAVNTETELVIADTHDILSQTSRRIDTTRALLSQISRLIHASHTVYTEVDQAILDEHTINSQLLRRIDATRSLRQQVLRARQHDIKTQVNVILYNVKNLRILSEFPSRGVSGLNWTASSTAAGDFSANNLNTDIVEQRWQSAAGVKTGITLVCDTQVAQGIFVDTMAILAHNLTTSASVVWQGSNDPGFASIGFTETLIMTTTNYYYIAPTLPQTSYRYWRFVINDVTNPANALFIGTILMGSSSIFQGECYVDHVIRGTVHFADKIETEGFTNVTNDRALKYFTSLEFKNLNYLKGNYQRMRSIFDTARTSLKCLWIPTPEYPSRFAVFGKLREIPDESHNVKGKTLDYVDFDITVDESL